MESTWVKNSLCPFYSFRLLFLLPALLNNPLLVFLFLFPVYQWHSCISTFKKILHKSPQSRKDNGSSILTEVEGGTQIPTCRVMILSPMVAPGALVKSLEYKICYWARYWIISSNHNCECIFSWSETFSGLKTLWWGHGSPHNIFPDLFMFLHSSHSDYKL